MIGNDSLADELQIDSYVVCPKAGFRRNQHSLSLTNLFQIITGCAAFFACMRVSAIAAICLTILVTPAIIRTGLISQQHQFAGLNFDWKRRLFHFAISMGVVVYTLLFALVVFAAVSLVFGMICVAITSVTLSSVDLIRDIGFIGCLGGMIWGAAAAIMAISLTHKYWILPSPRRL